ncbi:hypothetical protein DTO212C5_5982 [Paecilomyces variotii]|nr:hypothetical protein DTO212C5_5982 [Paecilomyces variotii]
MTAMANSVPTSRPPSDGEPSRGPTLLDLLKEEISAQISASTSELDSRDGPYLRIEGVLCASLDDVRENGLSVNQNGQRLVLGYLALKNGELIRNPIPKASALLDSRCQVAEGEGKDRPNWNPLSTPDSGQSDGGKSCKRRKVVGGLRLQNQGSNSTSVSDDAASDSGSAHERGDASENISVRQVLSDVTRFPLRKHKRKVAGPVLEPTSVDRLIAGIWRQVHSSVQLSRPTLQQNTVIRSYGSLSSEDFREVSMTCLRYYNQSQSSRALEMIAQAYWVECYEARIAAVRTENEGYSATDAHMAVLAEACAALGWKEKDLRNRLAIWRGYKEIKDAGGWACLIFASAGVYRFCKYRKGHDEGLWPKLQSVRHSVEVAADTLHPEWRNLVDLIGQGSPRRYHGNPHQWVTIRSKPAIPIELTYSHLPNGFDYTFIDECILDRSAFGDEDPRRMLGVDSDTCHICKQLQSDDVRLNRCSCYPSLFGAPKSPVPVQIFHTSTGKNNGIIARCNFERGTAIGEFVGLVTKGVQGMDVMVGGSRENPFQIFQGKMGNFTRFINHSCYPNCQFQKFYWRGIERIIVVSRGIIMGSEITVDYSDHYWKQLDKTGRVHN